MNKLDQWKQEREERERAKRPPVVITYIDGEINEDFIVVRNDETVPNGVRRLYGGAVVCFPGQGEDGYGRKITTDLFVQVKATGKRHRVYCTCFSNAGSHWIVQNKQTIHLGTVFQSDIRDSFYSEDELTPATPASQLFDMASTVAELFGKPAKRMSKTQFIAHLESCEPANMTGKVKERAEQLPAGTVIDLTN